MTVLDVEDGEGDLIWRSEVKDLKKDGMSPARKRHASHRGKVFGHSLAKAAQRLFD